jgi:hypothetical protein
VAERVGFFDRDSAILNIYSGFQLISRNRNDLAFSNLRRVFVRSLAFTDFSSSMALEMTHSV